MPALNKQCNRPPQIVNLTAAGMGNKSRLAC